MFYSKDSIDDYFDLSMNFFVSVSQIFCTIESDAINTSKVVFIWKANI